MTNNRVVITGCSGGGKSTLIEALAARGHHVVPEPGRIIVREELAGDGAALPWVSAEKFARRAIEMGKASHAQAQDRIGPMIFDRSILDATAAMERDGTAGQAEVAGLLAEFSYFRNVFIAPPWPDLFRQDEERQLGFDIAVQEYDHLSTYYPEHGYTLIELPKARVQQRVEFVENKLAQWFPKA